MIIQFLEIKELLDEFNDIAANAQYLAFFTRSIELQKKEVEKINFFTERATELKNSNKGRFSEPELNLILFFIIYIEAIKSELIFLISLKEGQMDVAWERLIHAQTQVSIASSNNPFNKEDLNNYTLRLDAYEKLLFPRMVFHSVGGIIRKAKCSICGSEYDDCHHLKGKMYKGELCVREIHEMDLEEVSTVDNPANKLCRCLSIQENGIEIDWLTLKEKTLSDKIKI
jgi:hypothetical protein